MGGDNSQLIELYSDADSGECPFAGYSSKDDQQQSCGKSRFGCWICTVVQEDRSLNGFIRSGHRELIPLAEFRKWLMSIRDVPEYREKYAVMEAYIALPKISLALVRLPGKLAK